MRRYEALMTVVHGESGDYRLGEREAELYFGLTLNELASNEDYYVMDAGQTVVYFLPEEYHEEFTPSGCSSDGEHIEDGDGEDGYNACTHKGAWAYRLLEAGA